MRYFNFRVWDRSLGTWHYFSLHPLDGLFDLDDRAIDGSSLTQMTGLKDKNGKDIFEGDVLQDRLGGRCVVRFESARYILVQARGAVYWPLSSDSSSHYEIIGNVIESPQLID